MQLRTDDIIDMLGSAGQFFTRLSRNQYHSLVGDAAGMSPLALCTRLLESDDDYDAASRLMVPPSFEEIESTQNNLFTGGMPLAALPIESLYRVWSKQGEGPFGRVRGMYQADCARHARVLCKKVGIEIPYEFSATPDHLALLLDLTALFLEAGNVAAARQVADDHLSWLDSYEALLGRRASEALEVEGYTASHRKGLEEGILFYRALVASISCALREMGQLPTGASERLTEQSIEMISTKEAMHV